MQPINVRDRGSLNADPCYHTVSRFQIIERTAI